MGRCCAGEATSLIQFVAAVACYISRDGRPQWEHYTPHRRQHQATHRCSCSLSGSSLKPGLVHSHSKSSYWVLIHGDENLLERIWEQRGQTFKTRRTKIRACKRPSSKEIRTATIRHSMWSVVWGRGVVAIAGIVPSQHNGSPHPKLEK